MDGEGFKPGDLPHAIPGLEATNWQPSELCCTLKGEPQPLSACLQYVLSAVEAQDEAWPFRHPVSVEDAPDYYEVIKDPIDLSMIRARLHRRPAYYVSVHMLLADMSRMFENCRMYNGELAPYFDCALRLEQFARARLNEIKVTRKFIKK